MLIDQTRLPGELLPLSMKSVRQLVEAILSLRVRGAPALGAAGAYGIALAADLCPAGSAPEVMADLEVAAEMIRGARPTAVNLSWGVDRALAAAARASAGTAEDVREAALAEAEAIAEEDIAVNRALGRIGAKLLDDGDTVLTHCNAGRLACVGWIQSQLRRADARELVFDLQRVRWATPEGEARQLLDKSIGGLMRLWGEP